jgi:hypothetical protein
MRLENFHEKVGKNVKVFKIFMKIFKPPFAGKNWETQTTQKKKSLCSWSVLENLGKWGLENFHENLENFHIFSNFFMKIFKPLELGKI